MVDGTSPNVGQDTSALDAFVGVRAGRFERQVWWRAICEPCGFRSSPFVSEGVARYKLRRHLATDHVDTPGQSEGASDGR
jgi:hypothetical protein